MSFSSRCVAPSRAITADHFIGPNLRLARGEGACPDRGGELRCWHWLLIMPLTSCLLRLAVVP
eukprot:10892615-Alexandrium_andersonii.AAC.1